MCPNCKEPVSQFAAGCAVCGTDLEAHRRARAQRRGVRLPGLPRLVEADLVVGVVALAILGQPLIGIVLALLALYRHPDLIFPGPRRTALIALCGIGVVLLLATGGVGILFYGG